MNRGVSFHKLCAKPISVTHYEIFMKEDPTIFFSDFVKQGPKLTVYHSSIREIGPILFISVKSS